MLDAARAAKSMKVGVARKQRDEEAKEAEAERVRSEASLYVEGACA